MRSRLVRWITGFSIIFLFLSACTGRDPRLVGRTWVLVSYGTAGDPTEASPGVATSLTFDEQGRMNANLGCNTISGDYRTSGSHLSTQALVSTLMACLDNGAGQQESAFLSAFNGPVEYRIAGNILTITSQGEDWNLVFESQP